MTLLDVQWQSDHLKSLGVVEVPRARYLELLRGALSDTLEDAEGASHEKRGGAERSRRTQRTQRRRGRRFDAPNIQVDGHRGDRGSRLDDGHDAGRSGHRRRAGQPQPRPPTAARIAPLPEAEWSAEQRELAKAAAGSRRSNAGTIAGARPGRRAVHALISLRNPRSHHASGTC